MADALNRILNDSQRAAEVYSELLEASNPDSKTWDFIEIRKDHEQIVGHVKRTLETIGGHTDEKPGHDWPGLKKHKALRIHEDKQVLQQLLDYEKTELADCEQLMSMGDGDRMVHTFVSTRVMPVLSSHIETLDRYLQRAQASGP